MPASNFCNDWVELDPNNFTSINQRLVGRVPDKFKSTPYIASKSLDLDAWKESDLVRHSQVNVESNFDIAKSGYGNDYHSFTENPFTVTSSKPLLLSRQEALFVQPLQPGVYKKSLISQPIISNYGLVMTPDIPPTTIEYSNGCTVIKDENSIGYSSTFNSDRVYDQASVYDPRTVSGGPGDSTSPRWNCLQGNWDYDYKLSNNIRMPSKISRSKLDMFAWSNPYGQHDDPMTSIPYKLAQTQWITDVNSRVNDLNALRMSKINSEKWQQRNAPIRTR